MELFSDSYSQSICFRGSPFSVSNVKNEPEKNNILRCDFLVLLQNTVSVRVSSGILDIYDRCSDSMEHCERSFSPRIYSIVDIEYVCCDVVHHDHALEKTSLLIDPIQSTHQHCILCEYNSECD